jgi:hypothetical protein
VLDQCSKTTPPSCVSAPFPLLQWSDILQPLPGVAIRPIDLMPQAISSDSMPFKAPALQPPVQALTAEEKKALLEWVAACGPSSAKACECPVP